MRIRLYRRNDGRSYPAALSQLVRPVYRVFLFYPRMSQQTLRLFDNSRHKAARLKYHFGGNKSMFERGNSYSLVDSPMGLAIGQRRLCRLPSTAVMRMPWAIR